MATWLILQTADLVKAPMELCGKKMRVHVGCITLGLLAMAAHGTHAEDSLPPPENEHTPHTRAITSIAFAPDGSRVVTGSKDKTVKVWDTSTGGVLRTFKGHREDV